MSPRDNDTQRPWEPIDFRRPTKLSREQVRSLDLFHDTFARRLSSSIGAIVRSSAALEIVRTTQVSWDEYVRSLPTVTTLVTASVRPLQGDVLIEMDTPLALALASRLLGGSGRMEPPRRPTDLEIPTLRRLGAAAVEALGDALSQFVEVDAVMESVDLSPQLLGLTAPTQMVLVLTYAVAVPGSGLAGDLSVVLSLSTLTPMLEKLLAHAAERAGADVDPTVMHGIAYQLPVVLEAQLSPTTMPAGVVAALVPGDVLVLDHRITQPATVSVAGAAVLRGHLGRRGSRLAISVSEHRFDEPAGLPGAPLDATHGPLDAPGHHGSERPAHDDAGVDAQARKHDARAADPGPSPFHSVR